MKSKIQLMNDEFILVWKPVHWKNYIWNGLFLLLSFIMITIEAYSDDAFGLNRALNAPTALFINKAITIITGTVMVVMFWEIIKTASIRYYVTNKRIVKVSGFLTIRTVEMLIERCETVNMKQDVYERIFGCADLVCLAPGSEITLEDVPQPEGFKAIIINSIPRK